MLAVAVLFALVAGYAAARTLLTSPQQRAANAAPMAAPILTATVKKESRQESISLEGTITYPDSISIPPPLAPDGVSILVDLVVSSGQELHSGDLIGEVSGTPVIALNGAFPLYRDLTAGDRGKDVHAVQSALQTLGYLRTADGVMGPATLEAVTALLEDSGYDHAAARSILAGPEDAAAPPSQDPIGNNNDGDGADGGDGIDGEEKTGDPTATAPAGTIPQGLFVMVGTLPSTILTTPVAVGADLTDQEALLTISPAQPVVSGDLSTVQADGIAEGTAVDLVVDGSTMTGTVRSVTAREDSDGLSTVLVDPEQALERDLVGQAATLTIILRSTDGDVLTVPAGAVHSDTATDTYVLVPGADGAAATQVPVDVLEVVDGAAVIVENEALQVGTEIILANPGAAPEDATSDTDERAS